MSNPSLPLAPAPPTMAAASSSSSPLRRARDPDDDDDLEEGELRVPVLLPRGYESSDSDTEDDDDDDGRRYLFQPRVDVEYDYASEARRRAQQHRRSPRRRPHRRLTPLDILFLGPGAGGALPSPTPSGDCESESSDATLSDDHHGRGDVNPTGSSSSAGTSSAAAAANAAAADAVGRGSAATGKRGWKAGGKNFVSLAEKPAAAVVAMPTPVASSDLNTFSAGDGLAGTTTRSPQAAPAAHQHQPPPLPERPAQPPRAPQPPPPRRQRKRERATEYTCVECGKSYPTNQALGGHAAGHKNKQREAAAMAAAMAADAAAAGGDASLAAAFLPLRGRFGKADETHECRQCGKVFGSGVALGGHMRVHYTGPPIVPARKNKKRCVAPPPSPPPAAVGLSLALSIKAEQDQPPSTPPPAVAAGAAVTVVRLFGIDITPPQVPAPLQQQQQGSGGTTEDSSATGQQQH